MKQLCLAVLLLCLVSAGHSQTGGGQSKSATLTTASASCTATNCVYVYLGNAGSTSVSIPASPSFTGTANFEWCAQDNTTCVAAESTGSSPVSSATAPGGPWQFNAAAFPIFRVRSSALSVGSISTTITTSNAPARSTSGGTLTANNIVQFDASGNLINSGATSDGSGNVSVTSLTASGAVTAGSLLTVPSGGAGGGFVSPEGTAPATIGGVTVPQAGYDACYADSTSHALLCSYNNGPWGYPPVIVGGDAATYTVSAGTGLIGSPVTLLATTLPTGLYKAEYEVAQLTHGNCTTPGTVSLRIGYTDGLTNVNYAVSSANAAVGMVAGNLGTTLVNSIVLATTINTASAYSGSKIFYALNGVAINYQTNQSVGASGGTCDTFDTFRVVVTVTKLK